MPKHSIWLPSADAILAGTLLDQRGRGSRLFVLVAVEG